MVAAAAAARTAVADIGPAPDIGMAPADTAAAGTAGSAGIGSVGIAVAGIAAAEDIVAPVDTAAVADFEDIGSAQRWTRLHNLLLKSLRLKSG